MRKTVWDEEYGQVPYYARHFKKVKVPVSQIASPFTNPISEERLDELEYLENMGYTLPPVIVDGPFEVEEEDYPDEKYPFLDGHYPELGEDVWFVHDGHHRVSLAIRRGARFIEALLLGVEAHPAPRENPASPALKESQKQTKRLSTKHAKARRERTPLQEIRARELKKIKRQDYYKVLATVKESVELERKGVYKITDPMGVLDDFLFNVLARQIEWSMEDIAQSGFPFLCYGLFEVTVPVRDSVRATYFGRTDHVRISAPRKLANRPRVYGEDFVLIPKKHNENLATRFTEPRFRWTIAHELGHRLHRKFESYIDVEMALEVFESKDKGAFVSRYARKNVSEMIAEAFACYIMPNYYLNSRKVSATRVYNCLKNFSKYIKVPTESPKKRLLEMTRVNPL